MEKCIYLPAKALAEKRYDMPVATSGEGESAPEPKEVMPGEGDTVDVHLTGRVSSVAGGMAKIEGLAINGFAVQWPGAKAKKTDEDEDAELEEKAEKADEAGEY